MNMRIIYILAIFLHPAFLSANAEMNVPAYPPQQWRLSVNFDLSRDVLVGFLDKKPGKNDFFSPEMLDLWLTDDGAIRGSSTHPVLTRKLPKGGFGGLGSEVIGYAPKVDQGAIYSSACAVLQSFRFVDSFSRTNFDDSGIDISIELQVNGRCMSVKYDKVQAKEGLPPAVASLLALLRRNLPACYSGFFDYLHVSRLHALTGEEANQYRQCQLHHEWMRVGDVSIAYGLLCPQKAYADARRKLFPNAHSYSAGGDVVTPESPKIEKVLYCPSCRQAEAKWQEKYDKKSKRATPK